jgi:hypothetical protein
LLIAHPEENSKVEIQEDNEAEFVITSERKRLIAKLEKSYSESISIDLMLPGNALSFMIFNFYESLTSALSKEAKIRVMAKSMDMRSGTRQKLENLKTHLNFELKYVETAFDFGLAICNDREVNIAISNKEVPSLWTNNRQIVKITKMMFENQWNAKSDPEYILQKAESVKVRQ